MNNAVKVGLSILLLICLLDMPYGYFQLVRFLSMIGFGFLAYDSNLKGKKNEVIIYIILAILFQPLLKISLGRTIWNIVDVITALGLLLSILISTNTKNKKS